MIGCWLIRTFALFPSNPSLSNKVVILRPQISIAEETNRRRRLARKIPRGPHGTSLVMLVPACSLQGMSQLCRTQKPAKISSVGWFRWPLRITRCSFRVTFAGDAVLTRIYQWSIRLERCVSNAGLKSMVDKPNPFNVSWVKSVRFDLLPRIGRLCIYSLD